MPPHMNVETYLTRIGYSGQLEPSYETLAALQTAHMLSVPFENLDIVLLHRPIQLDENSLWDKLVLRKRGGFCYELNGLFAWLLRQIGYQVSYLDGRVFRRTGELGIDYDHLALLASTPGNAARWLTDVGFGDSFLEPLELRESEQPQEQRVYRLESTGGGWVVWQKDYDQMWKREYFFDVVPRTFPQDYEAGCTYHQKSPESSFTRGSVVSKATADGRVTLEASKLIITRNGQRHEQPILADDWSRLLLEHFGVVL
jgi:N-hydroxyarylamine O-acetyltransferase